MHEITARVRPYDAYKSKLLTLWSGNDSIINPVRPGVRHLTTFDFFENILEFSNPHVMKNKREIRRSYVG